MTENISFKDFMKMDLRIGKINSVEEHPDADKLFIFKIGFGDFERQIVAGLKPYFSKADLIGKKVVVVLNLEPKPLRGVESQGMILAAEDNSENVVLLGPLDDISEGSKVH